MHTAVTLRLATLDDAQAVAALYRPMVVATSISFEEVPPGADEMRARIGSRDGWWPWIVATDSDGALLGFAYGSAHRERAAYRWSADVSIYVDPKAHRRGIGRALYGALFRLLAAQNYYHAFAGITLPNDASIGLHRALGFTPVGIYRHVGYKFGAWRDTSWWERPLRALEERPQEPVGVTSLDPETVAAFLTPPSVG